MKCYFLLIVFFSLCSYGMKEVEISEEEKILKHINELLMKENLKIQEKKEKEKILQEYERFKSYKELKKDPNNFDLTTHDFLMKAIIESGKLGFEKIVREITGNFNHEDEKCFTGIINNLQEQFATWRNDYIKKLESNFNKDNSVQEEDILYGPAVLTFSTFTLGFSILAFKFGKKMNSNMLAVAKFFFLGSPIGIYWGLKGCHNMAKKLNGYLTYNSRLRDYIDFNCENISDKKILALKQIFKKIEEQQ